MKLAIITMIFVLFLTTPALGEIINPLDSFLIIEDFPDNMTIGSQYQVVYNFSSMYDINVSTNFSILHPDIRYDEWNVSYILDGEVILPNETEPGIFFNETMISVGNHELITIFRSLPNIVPDEYGFTSELVYDGIVIASVKKKSGGGRRYPTPTPTPMPINATETPTPIPTDEPNETEMYINVTEPSQEQDDNNLYLYGIAVTLLAIMVAFLYRKRKGE